MALQVMGALEQVSHSLMQCNVAVVSNDVARRFDFEVSGRLDGVFATLVFIWFLIRHYLRPVCTRDVSALHCQLCIRSSKPADTGVERTCGSYSYINLSLTHLAKNPSVTTPITLNIASRIPVKAINSTFAAARSSSSSSL